MNDILVKNHYPFPLISSACPGNPGFHETRPAQCLQLVQIHGGGEWKVDFSTPGGYKNLVKPFGLTYQVLFIDDFQALVNDVLCDMLNIFVCLVNLDDILIFSQKMNM